jgi:hypothetical protein
VKILTSHLKVNTKFKIHLPELYIKTVLMFNLKKLVKENKIDVNKIGVGIAPLHNELFLSGSL